MNHACVFFSIRLSDAIKVVPHPSHSVAVMVAVGFALAVLAAVGPEAFRTANMAMSVPRFAANKWSMAVRAVATRFDNVLLASGRSCTIIRAFNYKQHFHQILQLTCICLTVKKYRQE